MDDDEAAFFSRPKRKLGAGQASPFKGSAALAQIETIIDSDDESSTDEDKPSHPKLAPKQTTNGAISSPGKTEKQASTNKFICINSSSDSEDAAVSKTRLGKRPRKSPSRTARSPSKTDTRKIRQRSDSLTPPPQLSPRGLRQGQSFVQNVFYKHQPPARTRVSDAAFTIVPDEAELLFEEQMRAKDGPLQRTESTLSSTGPASLSRQQSNSEPIPDDVLEIIIRGVYVDLPSSPLIVRAVKLWETPRMLRIRLNMKMSIAKIGFCKEAGMCELRDGIKTVRPIDKHAMSQIVLVHNNIRIFDHATPYALHIKAGDQPFFEAHTKEGWNYLEQHPELRASAQPAATGNGGGAVYAGDHAGDDGSGEDAMKITLRAKNGSELKVRVRPSTKITSILSGFRSKFSTPDSAKMSLRFEGDILGGTIGETDVEDGDVIDVDIS